MSRHRLEVADVFREYESEFLQRFGKSRSLDQRRAFDAIVACRTSLLGGHLEQCDDCGHQRIAYNSCRNRHCPKCQGLAQARWMDARATELLPIPYFHVVFTLPKEFRPIALQNQRVVYGILFRAAAETLKELAADPKHLGAEIGILAVLHTWGQLLNFHPHVHCIVTGGGLSPDGDRWVYCRHGKNRGKEFLIPVKVLRLVFRGKFIDLLKRAYRKGELTFHGSIVGFANPACFQSCLNQAVRNNWVIHVKRPFGSASRVLKYLARYTHRVAISNSRLLSVQNGRVHFQFKDYADGMKQKTTSLEATEFIRRFLMHVTPSGFMRIRHYGFTANPHRKVKLARCRELLTVVATSDDAQDEETTDPDWHPAEEFGIRVCPACGEGLMVIIQTFAAEDVPPAPLSVPACSRAPPLLSMT